MEEAFWFRKNCAVSGNSEDHFMQTTTEPERQIDVVHRTEVLVAGSGPEGRSAVLAFATGCALAVTRVFRRLFRLNVQLM